MSEAERFGLVKNLVGIVQKLASSRFAVHGSLYYKDTYPHSTTFVDPVEVERRNTSNFVIGPTTQRSFREDEKQELDIDRGPCMCILITDKSLYLHHKLITSLFRENCAGVFFSHRNP